MRHPRKKRPNKGETPRREAKQRPKAETQNRDRKQRPESREPKSETQADTPSSMAVRVVEFSNGVYKIRKIFAKKSTNPKKIIEF